MPSRWIVLAALLGIAAPAGALARAPDRGVFSTTSDDAPAERPTAARASDAEDEYARGGEVARELATLTGVSLSPLVGMSVLGAVEWWRTPARARATLPWHRRPAFWGVGLLLVVLLFLGDKVPFARQLVKAVRLVESKVVAALAMPVLANAFAGAVSDQIADATAAASGWLLPVAHAATAAGAPADGGFAASAAHVLAFAAGLVMAVAVWLAGHAVNVLVLVSPFFVVDAALRTARLALMGLVVWAANAHPAAGAAIAAVYVLVALLLSGWSFRLLVFGAVFSADVLSGRTKEPRAAGIEAFASRGIPGVPRRTWGRIERGEGGLVFSYRAWLVARRRTVPIRGPVAIGVGLFSPLLLAAESDRRIARFPPRYRAWEPELAATLGGAPVRRVGIVRGLRAALDWMRAEAPAVPAGR